MRFFCIFICIYAKKVVTLRPKTIYNMKHSYLLVLIALLLLSCQPTVSPLDDETLTVPAKANWLRSGTLRVPHLHVPK